jgi:hypothetical protein
MQGDRNRLNGIRLQHQGWFVDIHAPLGPATVRRKPLREQVVEFGSRPARLHEQPMDLCERINAPFDQSLEIVRCIGMRKAHRRQHSGRDILCSMFGLVCEIDDLRLAASALRDVLEAVERADNVSIDILDCLGMLETAQFLTRDV